MPHRTLAALAVPAALILPLAVPGVAEAAPAATATTRVAPSTAAHRQHAAHMHHLHVLHLRVLAARKAAATERARVVKAAERYVGQWYSYGNLDCSGLTQRAYGAVGKHLPRTAAAQGRTGRRVSKPKPGDLVAWVDSRGVAYHVGIYIGRARAVVARHSNTRVSVQVINWGHPTYRAIFTT